MIRRICPSRVRLIPTPSLLAVIICLLSGLATASQTQLPAHAKTSDLDDSSHSIYLPLVELHRWVDAPLDNGSFEGATWNRTYTGATYDNILVPEGWVAFWIEDDSQGQDLGRPEMDVIPRQSPYLDPSRIYEGDHALKWFTFYRNGDVGVYQRVPAKEGAWYRARAYVHVWYSTEDDPFVSQWRDSEGNVHTIVDGDPGMTAMIGIDPTGGTDPYASTVVWHSANIYDQFAPIELETLAHGPFVTVFLRTTTLFAFKHCDAYWDLVTLEVAE